MSDDIEMPSRWLLATAMALLEVAIEVAVGGRKASSTDGRRASFVLGPGTERPRQSVQRGDNTKCRYPTSRWILTRGDIFDFHFEIGTVRNYRYAVSISLQGWIHPDLELGAIRPNPRQSEGRGNIYVRRKRLRALQPLPQRSGPCWYGRVKG